MKPEANTPDLRQAQHPTVHHRTAKPTVRANLWIGEAVLALRALQARVARLRTSLQAAEEGGTRRIQAMEHICKTCALISRYSGRTSLMAGSCADCMAKVTQTPHISHAALRSCSPAL
jgi:hypothetical protein